MSRQTDRCGENYCDQNILEKLICNAQEKGEVGNTVAFALLTAGIAPAFVIALTKSIREKKIAETLPAASLALAGWGVEVIRCLREIRQKCNKQEPELGAEVPDLGADEDSSDSDSEEPTQQEKDVAKILNKFFDNTSCSNVSITADGCGKFTLIVRVLIERKKYPAKLNSCQMKSIQAATTNEEIYNIILPELKNQSVKSTFKNDKPPKLSIINQGSNICF